MDHNLTEHLHQHEDPDGAACTSCAACAVASGGTGTVDRPFPVSRIVQWGSGLLLAVAGWVVADNTIWPVVLFLGAYFLFGHRILWRAVQNLFRRAYMDEHVLMALATIAAFAIGEYPEAIAVTVFYQAGEFLQERSAARARRSIEALAELRPNTVSVVIDGGIQRVAPEDVLPGQVIRVLPGERVALDARVRQGRSSVDVSALTGESLPVDVGPGSEVAGGAVNGSGTLTLDVLRPFDESFPARIVHLVEEAESKKARTETVLTRFARVYTPAMTLLAFLMAVLPPLLLGEPFRVWIYRACMLLVISCPCALVLSVPLGTFAGLGAAARRGILIKGGRYLETLAAADTVAFDKTGTLTRGQLRVEQVEPVAGGPLDAEEFLSVLAQLTAQSTHPTARAVSAYMKETRAAAQPDDRVSDVREEAGRGLSGRIGDLPVLAGSRSFLEREGVSGLPDVSDAHRFAEVNLAAGGRYAGRVLLSDEIRPGTDKALAELRRLGVRRHVLLTGDGKAAAAHVASVLDVTEVHAQLLPEDKVRHMEELIRTRTGTGRILFAGDGINDAPVLARADAGIAVGAGGSDAAIENADIVLLSDNLSLIGTGIRLARKTARIIRQNVVLALGVKAAVVGLAAWGLGGIWQAVIADTGVALLAVVNAMRASRI